MFELILLSAVLVCLILVVIYRFKKIKQQKNKRSTIKWFSVFLPVLLLILLIKSVFIGSYKITTASMLSALEIGDLVVVNKLKYGIRSPISHTKIFETSTPKRGDVVVFYWSEEIKTEQLKRVIGLPGDKIEYIDKQLRINNKTISTRYFGAYEAPKDNTEYLIFNEDIPTGDKNKTAYSSMILEFDHYQSKAGDNAWVVPEGHYFVIGDNRDNSVDSRTQGFVPVNNIIGKVSFVWFHWNNGVQLSRIAKPATYSLPETIAE